MTRKHAYIELVGLGAALLGAVWCTGAAPVRPAAVGAIKTAVAEFTLRLVGDRGMQDVEGKSGVARIAPGQYWVLGWQSILKDGRGRKWEASATTFGPATTAQLIVVKRDQTVGVQLAPPLRAELTADAVGNRVNFRLHFYGPHGERCTEVKVDGSLPPKPWLTIRDGSGVTVTRMEFDYGCSFFCTYVWRAPQELKGSYSATVDTDFGPMRVQPTPPVSFTLAGVDPNIIAARPGAEAPDFTLKAVEDDLPLQLRAMRPRPMLLCFFCGCPLCAAVARQLAEAGDPKPELVALFNDPALCTPEAAKAFREKTGFRGAILADPDGRVAAAYDSAACPRCWAIDGDGMIRYVNPEPGTAAKEIVDEGVRSLFPR